MDFVDNLLGGGGCSAEGTSTRNPITGLADSLFDSFALHTNTAAPDAFFQAQAFGQSAIHSDELVQQHDVRTQGMVGGFQQMNMNTQQDFAATPSASLSSFSSPMQYNPHMAIMTNVA